MNQKPTITLYAPTDSASHVCVEGVMVEVKDGKVDVSGEQVAILIAHGFTTETPADTAPKKETAAEKKARIAAETEAAAAASTAKLTDEQPK